MANENALKSVVDSIGLGEEKNVNSLREMGNELVDKISEKIEEGTKQLDELKSGAEKVASKIISATVEVEQGFENKAAEVLEETKEKLAEPISSAECALSDYLGTLGEQVEKKVSENLEDFKGAMNRVAEDTSKFVSQKADELQKIEEKVEHITDAINKTDLIEDIGKVASEMSVGVEGLQKKAEAVADGLEEAKDKVCSFAEHIQEAVSEEKSKFSDEVNEEIATKLDEGKKKVEEFVSETFGKIQKLNEEKSDERITGRDEQVDGFKEEGKVDEINKVKDVISGSDDGKEQIVDGQMDDISVAVVANENVKKDELLVENSVGTTSVPSDATDVIGGDSQRDIVDGFVEEAGKMKEMAEEILSESVNAQEPKAIKKILPEGANVPEQAGILLESGVYLDDYEPVKPENMLTEKLHIVTDKIGETFDAHTKLNEPVGDVTQQEDIVDKAIETFQKTTVDQLPAPFQEQEFRDSDTAIDRNDINMSDNKSETQLIGGEGQELINPSPQASFATEQTKDLNLMSTESAGLPVTESTGPPVPEHLETTEVLSMATKNVEEKCSTEAKPESEVTMLIADVEKAKQEVLVSDLPHPKENISLTIDKSVTDVNKSLDVVPELSPPVTLQSFTAATPATPGNALQSPVDEHKIMNEAEMKSGEEETELKLQGSEAMVHGSLSSEIRNEKLELKNKMVQKNIETSKIQEECEIATDETKKRETMKEPVTEFQQADPKQIEKLETPKPEVHRTIPKAEAKPQESITDKVDKNKTNTLKSKSADGQQQQQQQSRRCTIL